MTDIIEVSEQGPPGPSSYTTTTANFTQPAVSGTVTVQVGNSASIAIGQPIFVQNGGNYLATATPTATSVTLQNTGETGNASPTTIIGSSSQVTASGVQGATGATGPQGVPGIGVAFGPLTKITAGVTTTLSQTGAQRVLIAVDGAAATAKFPPTPTDGDAIWVHTSGSSVVNPATLNPNGNNIEDPYLAPGSTGSGNVTMGVNPAASAVFVYEASGTLWRLWN